MNAETVLQRPTTGLARVGAVVAIVAGAALLLKVALIVATSNTIAPIVTGILFGVGVLTPLVAAAGIASMTSGGWLRKAGVYVGVVLVHAIYITMLSDGVGALVEPFTDAAYLVDEVPLAVLGLVWVIAGTKLRQRQAAA